jgi:hypothetical protein
LLLLFCLCGHLFLFGVCWRGLCVSSGLVLRLTLAQKAYGLHSRLMFLAPDGLHLVFPQTPYACCCYAEKTHPHVLPYLFLSVLSYGLRFFFRYHVVFDAGLASLYLSSVKINQLGSGVQSLYCFRAQG